MSQNGGRGFCLWFTGLPAAGKSTTAQLLFEALKGLGCDAELLDGDAVRKTVSQGLGFTKEDRGTHIRRVGALAAQLVRQGKIAICATISPYRVLRDECRVLMGSDPFIEIFVDTPLEVCEKRDPKGLYARARRGEISHFTGVSDPYEPPRDPELTLDTVRCTVEQNLERILSYLRRGKLVSWH